ncbi:MAG: FkbM family methyltransferase [Pseudomonadota bacterium]
MSDTRPSSSFRGSLLKLFGLSPAQRYPCAPSMFRSSKYDEEHGADDYFFSKGAFSLIPDNHCKATFEISRPFITRRDGVAIDIGCRDGEYSRYLQREFEHVYCFDPRLRPGTFPHNVDLRKVTHFCCALGDETSEITMYGGNHEPRDVKSHVAKCFRLDDFGFTEVAYMKIDVEGFETKVLAGAEATVARDRPLIVIEQNEVSLPGEGRYAAREWLEARGYRHVATCSRGWDMVMQHESAAA